MAMVAGSDQRAEIPIERTALYRVYGAEDELLYVGITNSFGRRWAQHAVAQPWWPDVQRQTVDWYPSRDDAATAETAAIKAEKPKYNIMHAGLRSRRPVRRYESDEDRRLQARIVGFCGDEPCKYGSSTYGIASPDVVAPGTYLITFDYDRNAADPDVYDPDVHDGEHESIRISKCILVDSDDEVALAHGGKHRPVMPPAIGAPLTASCRCYLCA